MENKPLSLLIEEFSAGLAEVLNSSPLHPAIKNYILNNAVNEVSKQAAAYRQAEMQAYNKKLQEENTESVNIDD